MDISLIKIIILCHGNLDPLAQALHVWLDQFPEDFKEPPNFPCLSHFESFCRRIMPGSELDSKVQRKGKVLRKVSSNPLWPILQRQSLLWF